MRLAWSLLPLALGAACRPPDPTPKDDAEVRYLALGDSFTIGTGSAPDRAFPARLAERWRARGCTVALRNVAVNGYATDDVIDEELPAIATFHPTFVTVAVGANDIVRGRSLAAYRANVRRILDAARAAKATVIALPQPDWSRSPTAAAFGAPSAIDERIRELDAILAEEAAAAGARFVDLSPLMGKQADAKMLASDGLHPSAEAYDAWADELARAISDVCRRGG